MLDLTHSNRTPTPPRDAPTDIEGALNIALSSNSGTVVTDIIIHEGQPIRAKSARGTLPLHQLFQGIAAFPVTRAHIADYLAPLDGDRAAPAMAAGRETRIDPELARRHPLCFRIEGPGGTSLRCSLFVRNTGELALVMRVSPGTITPLSYLNIPQELLTVFTESTSGFIVITGPTGAGKSETAMSVLDWHNAQHAGHILTIEDPVEKRLASRKSIVSQREVGVGVPTFADGMRSALRMSPDILYASEIGDAETAMQAIQGGESGSLMIATTHGKTATGALRKILGHLGPGADAMRQVLAGNLIAVVRQALVPARSGERYLLVADVLYNTGRVTQYIEKGDWTGLETAMRQDHYLHTNEWWSMSARLAELVEHGEIDIAEAMRETSDIPTLRRRLSGISPFTTYR
jgi:Tfp pilus assembly pilus retraction ATPase PilT